MLTTHVVLTFGRQSHLPFREDRTWDPLVVTAGPCSSQTRSPCPSHVASWAPERMELGARPRPPLTHSRGCSCDSCFCALSTQRPLCEPIGVRRRVHPLVQETSSSPSTTAPCPQRPWPPPHPSSGSISPCGCPYPSQGFLSRPLRSGAPCHSFRWVPHWEHTFPRMDMGQDPASWAGLGQNINGGPC